MRYRYFVVTGERFELLESKLTNSQIFALRFASDDELKDSFNKLKEDTIQKLNLLNQKESDSEIKSKVDETISKIQNENVDRLNYFKLKKLNETI
jgi:hypothetical protein